MIPAGIQTNTKSRVFSEEILCMGALRYMMTTARTIAAAIIIPYHIISIPKIEKATGFGVGMIFPPCSSMSRHFFSANINS